MVQFHIYPKSFCFTSILFSFSYHMYLDYIKFEFVVGLIVHSEPGGAKELLNPFQNMAIKGRLGRNLSSLNLPREEGDYGEILFGSINHDLYVGELNSLPLLKETGLRWGVAANRLEIDDGEGLFLGWKEEQQSPKQTPLLSDFHYSLRREEVCECICTE